MALANYTLPFGGGGIAAQNWATISPLQQHATAVNNLLYGPAGHQNSDQPPDDDENDDYYKNDPYAPPSHITNQQLQQQYRNKNNNYLPPPLPSQPSVSPYGSTVHQRTPYNTQTTRTYGESSYSNVPTSREPQQNTQYFNSQNNNRRYTLPPGSTAGTQTVVTPPPPPQIIQQTRAPNNFRNSDTSDNSNNNSDNTDSTGPAYPSQAGGFTRVHAGQGSRTQVHAVLDYDDDGEDDGDYRDETGKLILFPKTKINLI